MKELCEVVEVIKLAFTMKLLLCLCVRKDKTKGVFQFVLGYFPYTLSSNTASQDYYFMQIVRICVSKSIVPNGEKKEMGISFDDFEYS